MLKIKEDVDLKEIAKKYNMKYCEDWSIPYEDDNYGKIINPLYGDLTINWRDDLGIERKIDSKLFDETLDFLYDLIKADLVEKVDD